MARWQGLAIVAVGIFSACYHVCPGERVFQFDTTMMFVICALQTLALYQKRHSDTIAQAHNFYIVLALYVFIVVVGEPSVSRLLAVLVATPCHSPTSTRRRVLDHRELLHHRLCLINSRPLLPRGSNLLPWPVEMHL